MKRQTPDARRRTLFLLLPAVILFMVAAGGADLVLKLRHKRPADVAALIGAEISPSGALSADNAAMTLTLRESPARFDYFRKRIQELDIPPQPFSIQLSLGTLAAAALPGPGDSTPPPPPVMIASARKNLKEGESATVELARYRLQLGLGLYDNRSNQLRLSELKLYADNRTGAGAAPIFTMAARLKAGRATVFAIDRPGATLILQVQPELLPAPPDTTVEPR
jgi:hypothetical protein